MNIVVIGPGKDPERFDTMKEVNTHDRRKRQKERRREAERRRKRTRRKTKKVKGS